MSDKVYKDVHAILQAAQEREPELAHILVFYQTVDGLMSWHLDDGANMFAFAGYVAYFIEQFHLQMFKEESEDDDDQ